MRWSIFWATLAVLLVFIEMSNISAIAIAARGPDEDAPTLVAGDLQLTLVRSSDGIQVTRLTDQAFEQELLPQKPLPLWEIIVSDPKTKRKYSLTADEGWQATQLIHRQKGLELHWAQSADPQFTGLHIVAVVNADAESNALHWNLQIKNEGNLSIYAVAFPQIGLERMEEGRLFYPALEGRVEKNAWNGFSYSGGYGGAQAGLPFFAAYSPGRSGLYLALHDPHPTNKNLTAEHLSEAAGLKLAFFQYAEDASLSGNSFQLSGEGIWQLIRGDWFDAAMIYRQWAQENASWYPGSARPMQTPAWMRELPVWIGMHDRGDVSNMEPNIELVKEFIDYMQVPVGIHWYGWHSNPYDNDVPHYFPPLAGELKFGAAVQELQEAGAYVMPYINVRLWDTRDGGLVDKAFSSQARPAAVKDEDGAVYVRTTQREEADGSTVRVAVMDPTTAVWQGKIKDIVQQLFNKYGVDGVYLDQLSHPPEVSAKYLLPAGAPVEDAMSTSKYKNPQSISDPLALCFDPSHGHPLGGGHWWIDGYRELLEDLRDTIPKEAIITSESTPEMYMGWIDGGLSFTWGRLDGTVPAIPAVYGGAFQMFGRQYFPNFILDYLPEVRMKTAQALVYGNQLGWWDPDIIEKSDELNAFLYKLIHLRYRFAPYFYSGQMSRPPQLDVPSYTAMFHRGNTPITTDAVLSGAWERPDESRLLLVFVNITEEDVATNVQLDLSTYGFEGDVRIEKIGPEGAPMESFTSPVNLQREVSFAAQTAWAWEITPLDQPHVRIVSPAYGQQVQGRFPIELSTENLVTDRVQIDVDGAIIYESDHLPAPGEVSVSAKALSEGRHQLSVTITDDEYRRVTENARFSTQKMTMISPEEGAVVSGDLPVALQLTDLTVQDIDILADGDLLLTDKDPAALTVNTLKLPDGEHRLSVTVTDSQGRKVSRSVGITVQNWTTMRDQLLPPLENGFLGSLDRSLTSVESDGWTYADPLPLFGDVDRKVRRADTAEQLIWLAPGLKAFSIAAFAVKADVRNSVVLAVSNNGSDWQEINYKSAAIASENGWVKLELTGELSPTTSANWFRLTFRDFSPAAELQVGEVSLQMLSGLQ